MSEKVLSATVFMHTKTILKVRTTKWQIGVGLKETFNLKFLFEMNKVFIFLKLTKRKVRGDCASSRLETLHQLGCNGSTCYITGHQQALLQKRNIFLIDNQSEHNNHRSDMR